MREKPKRSPKMPEDNTFGRMFSRLRAKVGVRYVDIAEWVLKQDRKISPSSFTDMSSGRSVAFMSRIPLVAKYFREVHGLDYVDSDYLLIGDEIEQKYVEREYEVIKSLQSAHVIEQLPLEEFADRETA